MTSRPPQIWQRASVLVHLPELMREFGVSADGLFESFGIDLKTLAKDTLVEFAAGIRILARAAELTQCEHLGLLLGSRFQLDEHGPIAELMRTAPSLEQALLDFVTWQHGYSSGAVAYLHRARGGVALGYATYRSETAGSRHLYELSMAVACGFIRDLTANTARPLEVHLCTHRPANRSLYERILQAPILFDQHQSCVYLSDQDAALPLASRNDERRHALLQLLDAKYRGGFQSPGARARHYMRPQILKGDVSYAGLARVLGLHPRTLRRRLVAEGTTFDTLIDQVRMSMACELLELTELQISEISSALGYSIPSNFAHAFRRWTGFSPTCWRGTQSLLASGTAPPATHS
jgi:AraC-like DNA-binding protein